MNGLTQELYDLALELNIAGVQATVDPGRVLSLLAAGGVCALIKPTTTYGPLTFGLDFDLVVPVWLITPGPYDLGAVERLDAALLAAWPVVRPIEPATRTTYEDADTAMPALLIPVPRHVDCAP
jgi:hypothetical protein